MSGSITHVAGAVVSWSRDRCIQRCAACGQKLCDSQGAMMPLEPDGSAQKFPTWPEGHLVNVDAGQPTRSTVVGKYVDVPELPADFCGFQE